MKLSIDPGHGGYDNNGDAHLGAIYKDLVEADWTLQFAKRLQADIALLCEAPIQTQLIRSSDYHLSLSERGRIASEQLADMVLSVHINANADPKRPILHGLSCWVWPGNANTLSAAKKLIDHCPVYLKGNCQRIVETVKEPQSGPKRWRHRARNVVRSYIADTLLVEYGFVQSDYKHLKDKTIQSQLSMATCYALDQYHMTRFKNGKYTAYVQDNTWYRP